jgi:hypothetical protein
VNAVDRRSFDEIYHLGSRAWAFWGNSCGIVFYRLTPTEIAKRGAGWGLNPIASENVFIKLHTAIHGYPGESCKSFFAPEYRLSGGV